MKNDARTRYEEGAHDCKFIGFAKRGAIFISCTAMAKKGDIEREVRKEFELIRRFPVKADLSGRTVMVVADSHEDAVNRYLSRTRRRHDARG